MNNSSSFHNIKKPTECIEEEAIEAQIQQQKLIQTLYASNNEVAKGRMIVGKRNSTIINGSQPGTGVTEDVQSFTTRRGPPKAHHHKLPSAFSFSQQRKPSGKPSPFGKMVIPKIPEENITQKIESMVDISEYKQIQNLLSPLKMKEGKVVHNKLKKLLSFHELNVPNGLNDSALGITQPSSPFQVVAAPQGREKFHKKEISDQQIEKLNQKKNEKQIEKLMEKQLQDVFSKQSNHTLKEDKSLPQNSFHFKIKLEEMITLNMIKTHKHSGAIKKMLHAPTLTIFAVKEQPISSKEVRQSLRNWLNFWPQFLNSNEQFIKVYGAWWNVPEGCVSIIMEHVEGGSLQDLLESVNNLNERSIREVAEQLIQILLYLHGKHQICHSGLSPSQILIDREGRIKISLGITTRSWSGPQNKSLNTMNANNVFSSIISTKKNNDNQGITNTWTKSVMEKQDENLIKLADATEKSEEIFKFGLIMLLSALGNLDFLEDQDSNVFNIIHKKIEEATKSDDQVTCCLLHDKDWGPVCYNLSLDETLQGYSQKFKEFLCKCLQYNSQRRSTIQSLLKHPFITSAEELTFNSPSLTELMAVSYKISKQQYPLPEQFQAASEKQLARVCEGISLILPNCQQWFKMQQYSEFVSHLPNLQRNNTCIQALSMNLGMDPSKVHSKIVLAFEQVPLFKDFKHKYIFNPSSSINNI